MYVLYVLVVAGNGDAAKEEEKVWRRERRNSQ